MGRAWRVRGWCRGCERLRAAEERTAAVGVSGERIELEPDSARLDASRTQPALELLLGGAWRQAWATMGGGTPAWPQPEKAAWAGRR